MIYHKLFYKPFVQVVSLVQMNQGLFIICEEKKDSPGVSSKDQFYMPILKLIVLLPLTAPFLLLSIIEIWVISSDVDTKYRCQVKSSCLKTECTLAWFKLLIWSIR